MLNKLPNKKIKSNLSNRFDTASLSKVHAMAWINYLMLLQRLAKLAADNAKADRSVVIRRSHVREAGKKTLRGSRG